MYSSGSDTFYKYYQQQQQGGALAHIGGIPVFRGSSRQSGAGLGDILRSAFRWFLPVAKRGAMTFAKSMISNLDQGTSFRDAAKAAIRPTLNVAAEAVKDKFANMQAKEGPQAGSGRRRKANKRARKLVDKERVYKGAKKLRMTASKQHQVGSGANRRSSKKVRKTVKKKRRVQHHTVDSAPYYNF